MLAGRGAGCRKGTLRGLQQLLQQLPAEARGVLLPVTWLAAGWRDAAPAAPAKAAAIGPLHDFAASLCAA
jgi:hypothetical protein